MLRTDSLGHDTRILYEALRTCPDLRDYRLLGGTAIALHHAHRRSEDIDLTWCPNDGEGRRLVNLDRESVDRVIAGVRACGLDIFSDNDPYQVELAENDGFDILDGHQDWRYGDVRLTFFAPEDKRRSDLHRSLGTVEDGHVRLLSSDALFELKSRLLVHRLAHRDIFDLWFFVDRLGKLPEDVIVFARDENPYWSEKSIVARLLSGKFSDRDTGVKSILQGGPENAADLLARMEALFSFRHPGSSGS